MTRVHVMHTGPHHADVTWVRVMRKVEQLRGWDARPVPRGTASPRPRAAGEEGDDVSACRNPGRPGPGADRDNARACADDRGPARARAAGHPGTDRLLSGRLQLRRDRGPAVRLRPRSARV